MARPTTRLGRLILAVAAGAALATASPASSQIVPIVLETVEDLDFDRPEAWAMKYYTSLSLLTGLGTPGRTRPGELELAFEGGVVPSLGEEKRRVGFVGDKVEDLNRTNLFGRVRATWGLPHDFALTVAVTPPVEVNGVTPKLLALALARPILDRERWRLGWRLHGQVGKIEGDLTCPRGVAGLDDPALNPDGCLEPSRDEATQNYVGLELAASPRIGDGRWEPYVALSVQHLDLEFQVRARYSVLDDRTRLLADGLTWALTAGTSYRLGERWRVAGEIFYTPLDVVRDPVRGAQNDELVNARGMLVYALP